MSYLTESGIPDIGRIPWGSHFCQMYSTQDDLAQSLVPYFAAGLVNNERCIWITSEPYGAEKAAADFKNVMPEFRNAISRGRIKIYDYDEWYTRLPGGKIAERWLEEEELALSEGWEGLRISGNTSFVGPSSWDAFMEYERLIHKAIADRKIIALCSYSARRIEPTHIFETVRAHHFTIHRNNGFWEMFDSPV